MDAFFQSQTVKIITLALVAIVFAIILHANKKVNSQLAGSVKAQHAKLAKDAWVKTILLFGGSAAAALVAFFHGGIDKALSQAFFGLCLFTAIGSLWTIKKTNAAIEEAKQLSLKGKRKGRIEDVQRVNKEKAVYNTYLSLAVGLAGFIFVAFFFEKYPFPWLWFAAFLCTGFGILSARWSEFANQAIAKYASDPKHGV